MVKDSLSRYLVSKISNSNVTEEETKSFVYELVYHGNKTSDSFDVECVKALYSISVLDPACGSGSFPLNVLNNIDRILSVRIVEKLRSGVYSRRNQKKSAKRKTQFADPRKQQSLYKKVDFVKELYIWTRHSTSCNSYNKVEILFVPHDRTKSESVISKFWNRTTSIS